MKFRHGGLSGRLMPRGKLKENEALPHHRLGHRARSRRDRGHARERQPHARAPPPPPPPPPLATTDVLVAKADLNTGQVINEGDLGWQTWPATSASSALVRKSDRPDAIKEFVGAMVRSPMVAGEPIRDSKVVLARGGGFMAAVLPHGMRAIALDITPDNDAGGFILPNDHVDVILDAPRQVGGEDRRGREIHQRNDPAERAGARGRPVD